MVCIKPVLKAYVHGNGAGQSPFFFHSKVIESSSMVYIELKKIYRQNEQRFINILNHIRNNEILEEDLKVLNGRFRVDPIPGKKYITLTSHNYKADRINTEELRKLSSPLYEFKGTIEGDFPEKTLPTEINLQIKEGAQVMFLRNDKSEERRYYNGKLATVIQVSNQSIRVAIEDSGHELDLEKETWENIRYSYNPAEEKIDEEKLGSFSQYPIRLAWAITIHKSQGLTFENAIIDAGDSFAPGQVYVALSRCVSLDGLILHSQIDPGCISTHDAVISFAEKETEQTELEKLLQQERHVFANAMLIKTFDFSTLSDAIEDHSNKVRGKTYAHIESAIPFVIQLSSKFNELEKVSDKFATQLAALLKENDPDKIKERVSKAITYFTGELNGWISMFEEEREKLKKAKKVKKYFIRKVFVF